MHMLALVLLTCSQPLKGVDGHCGRPDNMGSTGLRGGSTLVDYKAMAEQETELLDTWTRKAEATAAAAAEDNTQLEEPFEDWFTGGDDNKEQQPGAEQQTTDDGADDQGGQQLLLAPSVDGDTASLEEQENG